MTRHPVQHRNNCAQFEASAPIYAVIFPTEILKNTQVWRVVSLGQRVHLKPFSLTQNSLNSKCILVFSGDKVWITTRHPINKKQTRIALN